MKRFIILAALAISSTASAQEFSGKCTAYDAREACAATQWCVWRKEREITLPDGQAVALKGSCAFKPHHEKAWLAKAQTKVPAQ